MSIFRQNRQPWLFRPKFAQKWVLGSWFQKSKFEIWNQHLQDTICANLKFFGQNLVKLPNYMQYFGSNNIEGIAERCVEAEISWVDVDRARRRWLHGLAISAYILSQSNLSCLNLWVYIQWDLYIPSRANTPLLWS